MSTIYLDASKHHDAVHKESLVRAAQKVFERKETRSVAITGPEGRIPSWTGVKIPLTSGAIGFL